jgi:beta-galactosidase
MLKEIPMRDSTAGYNLAKELADFVRTLDPTRPVTAAVPMVRDSDEPFLAALDVGGYGARV